MSDRKNEVEKKKFYEAFGRSILLKREAAGLNQTTFAEVFGKTTSWTCTVEKAKVQTSFYEAMAICNLLNIDLDRLSLMVSTETLRSRLAEMTRENQAELDNEIKEAEAKLKTLRERKMMTFRVVGNTGT